jgi:hypothetical protein
MLTNKVAYNTDSKGNEYNENTIENIVIEIKIIIKVLSLIFK